MPWDEWEPDNPYRPMRRHFHIRSEVARISERIRPSNAVSSLPNDGSGRAVLNEEDIQVAIGDPYTEAGSLAGQIDAASAAAATPAAG